MQPETLILLNAGTKTRKAFQSALQSARLKRYQSKRLLLHIDGNCTPHFLSRNTEIDWAHSRVFTRLRATDQHFVGMLYEYFAHEGISANDPINRSYPNSAEKISQMLLLALSGIAVPESFICREEAYAHNRAYLEEHLVFPAVFKTDGSKGMQVVYVQNMAELDTCMQQKTPTVLGLIQPFIENTFDTRTIVAYDTVLGTIARTRTTGFLNNIAQGAKPSLYELTETEKNIAQKAAQVTGIDIAGVDMIHTDQGPIVLEVNKSPQVAGFERVHGFSVFGKIAEIIERM